MCVEETSVLSRSSAALSLAPLGESSSTSESGGMGEYPSSNIDAMPATRTEHDGHGWVSSLHKAGQTTKSPL